MTWENGEVTSPITDVEIIEAINILERAKYSWPDLADISCANMVIETAKKKKIKFPARILFIEKNGLYRENCKFCFYQNKKRLNDTPKPPGVKCLNGMNGYFVMTKEI